MLLSIIIPIYNLEKYISKCLDSIIGQLNDEIMDEIEIILVNDGSTDTSEQICKKYGVKHRNIQYIYQKNSGVSVARNHGLNLSKGEYVYFVDGDDFLLNNSIMNIYSKIKDKKADMILCNYINVYGENIKHTTTQKRENKISKLKNKNKTLCTSKLYDILNRGLFTPSMWCNVVRKEILDINNIKFDENVKYTEDMEVAFKTLLVSNTFEIILNPVYAYRKSNDNSATHKITEKRIKDNFNFYIKLAYKNNYSNLEKRVKEYILKFANYEYSIVVATLFLAPKGIFNKEYNKIKKHEKSLENIKGFKGKVIKYIYKIFGFDITGKILAMYLKSKI